MIDPTKLTADQGFVDGVVVEIVDVSLRVFVGRLRHVTEWNIWLVESNLHGFTFDEVKSIRPLTGPMAIWNFAPDGPNWCRVWDDGEIWWEDDEPSHGSSGWTYTKRPFWATKE